MARNLATPVSLLSVPLSYGAAALDFYEQYLGNSVLPLQKFDLVAIPGRTEGSSNWGLIAMDSQVGGWGIASQFPVGGDVWPCIAPASVMQGSDQYLMHIELVSAVSFKLNIPQLKFTSMCYAAFPVQPRERRCLWPVSLC
jgi:hypothetical protein